MTTERKITKPDALTAIAVTMLDRNGKLHLVARGEAGWMSRKFIATRNAFSGQWLLIGMGTDADFSASGMTLESMP